MNDRVDKNKKSFIQQALAELPDLPSVPAEDFRKLASLVIIDNMKMNQAASAVGIKYGSNEYYMSWDILLVIKKCIDNSKDLLDFRNWFIINYRNTFLEKPANYPPLESSVPDAERPKDLAALQATPPSGVGYDLLAKGLEEETRSFRQRVAATLLPALKEEMQRKPHDTYEDKIDLVRWVNAELRRFALAITHPKTGQPAAFKPYPGNHPEIGAFQLVSKDADGKEKTFTTPDLSILLVDLELMEAASRREGLAEWHEKVSQPRRGAKRG